MFEIIGIFSNWCKQKIGLHTDERTQKLFKQGEVWWCRVGMNVGREMYGKGENFTRPVLVFKKISSDTFLALPVTSKIKTGSWFVTIEFDGRKHCVVLNQARVVDARRLLERIYTPTQEELTCVRKSFFDFYGL